MKSLLLSFLLLINYNLFAQHGQIVLSPKHQEKLSHIRSGHARLIKYYKFYKTDSAKNAKSRERQLRRFMDSTWKADNAKYKLERKLLRKGIYRNHLSVPDTFNNEFSKWNRIAKDTTLQDSVRTIAKGRAKVASLVKLKEYPQFQSAFEKYQLYDDTVSWQELSEQVPGVDTLSTIFSSPTELFEETENTSVEYLDYAGSLSKVNNQMREVGNLKNLPEQYADDHGKYIDREYLKKQGTEKATIKAVDHFAQHADKLEAAQKRVSKLLLKYKDFANSDDLNNAKKHTSMQGKSFWEHLIIAGNFNIISTKPLSIDFSPQVGYKFTTNFFVGLGMNYRFTFRDSIKNNFYVSPSNTSLKLFANYEFIKSFYVLAEWEKSPTASGAGDNHTKHWEDNYFLGVGRRFLVHPKLYVTLTALYNFNNEQSNPIHPKRFQLRIGFLLSELAIRKKRINYDPNR